VGTSRPVSKVDSFIFAVPVYFFLSFLLMYWCIFTSITYGSEMNGKKTGAGRSRKKIYGSALYPGGY